MFTNYILGLSKKKTKHYIDDLAVLHTRFVKLSLYVFACSTQPALTVLSVWEISLQNNVIL